jgi:TRAP-type C4-dicarboxylate transport system substrate-binding protein
LFAHRRNGRNVLFFASLLLCLAISSPVWSAQRTPEKIHRLSMSGSYPDTHPLVLEVLLPWAEEIREKTQGRVVITYYNPDLLFPEKTHFGAVRQGNLALGQQFCGRSPETFVLNSILGVPAGLGSSGSASAAILRLYKSQPEMQREYSAIKLLTLYAAPPFQLHSLFPLESPEDLRGKRILCSDSSLAAMLSAAGAIPLLLPEASWAESFSGLEAQGALLSFDLFSLYNLDRLPLTRSIILNISTEAGWLGMNKSAWESLPRNLRQIIESSSGDGLSQRMAQALDKAAGANRGLLAERGLLMRAPDEEERRRWLESLEPAARSGWLERMRTARIGNAEKILERFMTFCRESESAGL